MPVSVSFLGLLIMPDVSIPETRSGLCKRAATAFEAVDLTDNTLLLPLPFGLVESPFVSMKFYFYPVMGT